MTFKPSNLFRYPSSVVVSIFGFLFVFSLAQAEEPEQRVFFAGTQSCRACHQEIVETYVQTAHFETSQLADEHSIQGSFASGSNTLKTGNPNVYFRMEKRQDGFYQTAYRNEQSTIRSRRERFDLVMGSGRKGQSYLYWKDGLLFQLPVSYLVASGKWTNSPGMIDGQIVFDRFISPRCLECHTTLFRAEIKGSKARYSSRFLIGLSCEKCHGAGSAHVDFHKKDLQETEGRSILNPDHFPRERKLDQCALCHSGAAKPIKPPFSYRPGEPLSEYLEIEPVREGSRPDVHANQVGLLRLSRCFTASDDMSCSTCHNVHTEQRNLSELAQKCMQCHRTQECGTATKAGVSVQGECIECHMPNEKSNLITIDSGEEAFFESYRNHTIAVYPDVADQVLQRLMQK